MGACCPRHAERTTVGELAAAEALLLASLPPAFTAALPITRVSAQARVAFRGNRYSVPPGLGGATVTVSHRLGEQTLDVARTSGTVLARHRREPDGAGVVVGDTVHVTTLEQGSWWRSTPTSPVTARPAGHPRPQPSLKQNTSAGEAARSRAATVAI